MHSVAIQEVLDTLPVRESVQTLGEFLEPMTELMPDKRLEQVVQLRGPFLVGSGKSFTPWSRMHWANFTASS